jgi:hypothetical protein
MKRYYYVKVDDNGFVIELNSSQTPDRTPGVIVVDDKDAHKFVKRRIKLIELTHHIVDKDGNCPLY